MRSLRNPFKKEKPPISKISDMYANLAEFPPIKKEEKVKKGKVLLIGDLHGNPLKFIYLLARHQIINLSKADYTKLKNIILLPSEKLTKKELGEFDSILNEITITKNSGQIRLLGDILADRGHCDYFNLKIIEMLEKDKRNIIADIICSNHDDIFMRRIMGDDQSAGEGMAQHRTVFMLEDLMRKGLVEKEKVIKIVNQYYKPKTNLISYDVSHEEKEKAVKLYIHAPALFTKELDKFIKEYKITPRLDGTLKAFLEVIDKVNDIYREQFISGRLPIDNPGFKFLWARYEEHTIAKAKAYIPSEIAGYPIQIIHGHDNSSSLVHRMTSLDNLFGRADERGDYEFRGYYNALMTNFLKQEKKAVLAVQRNELKELGKLIDSKVDVNKRYAHGETLAMTAAKNDHIEVLIFLIEKKADVTQKSTSANSLACIAVSAGSVKTMQYLLEQKADINSKNSNNETLSMLAAKNGHAEVLDFLLAAKADINQKDQGGNTLACMAADRGHKNVLETLFKKDGKLMEEPNNNGWTPAFFAAGSGDVATMAYLIEAKAKLNAETKTGGTLVFWVVTNNRVNMLRFLQDKNRAGAIKIDFNKAQKNVTPVMAAAYHGRADMIKILYEQKVDLDQKHKGYSLAMMAAENGHVNVLQALDECKVDIAIADKTGEFPKTTHKLAKQFYALQKFKEYIIDQKLENNSTAAKQLECITSAEKTGGNWAKAWKVVAKLANSAKPNSHGMFAPTEKLSSTWFFSPDTLQKALVAAEEKPALQQSSTPGS